MTRIKAIHNVPLTETRYSLVAEPTEKVLNRFLTKIKNYENLTEDECWIWDGSLSKSGDLGTRVYGNFSFEGKPVYAHRMSYALLVGPIPYGAQINHACNNPLCVNPKHLHLGDARSNMDECLDQGRFPNCQYHPQAKLTNEQVKVIFSLKGKVKQREMARMFNVSETTISAILNGKTWTKLNTNLEYVEPEVITVGEEN